MHQSKIEFTIFDSKFIRVVIETFQFQLTKMFLVVTKEHFKNVTKY
jgi:hypothetical protein